MVRASASVSRTSSLTVSLYSSQFGTFRLVLSMWLFPGYYDYFIGCTGGSLRGSTEREWWEGEEDQERLSNTENGSRLRRLVQCTFLFARLSVWWKKSEWFLPRLEMMRERECHLLQWLSGVYLLVFILKSLQSITGTSEECCKRQWTTRRIVSILQNICLVSSE